MPSMTNSTSAEPPQGRIAALDAQALANLRALDPKGESHLVQRVVQAFETSAARLLPQMRSALAAGDVAGVRQVAHTLKSSSASVGAMLLSRQCAEIEAMVRENRVADLEGRVAEALAEIGAVLAALRRLPEAGA
jgi:HPt (histidine-containing phosphotransfer) domain-containing protein